MRATISSTHTVLASIPLCFSLSPIHPCFLATCQVTLRTESAVAQTGSRHMSRGAFRLRCNYSSQDLSLTKISFLYAISPGRPKPWAEPKSSPTAGLEQMVGPSPHKPSPGPGFNSLWAAFPTSLAVPEIRRNCFALPFAA
jgi:hypothetical protein